MLIDPRKSDDLTGGIFYVGKGQGQRAFDHGRNAGIIFDTANAPIESEKTKIIKEIRESGCDVNVMVLGRFDTEPEAFAVEATLIHWVYGRIGKSIEEKGVLTNVQSGKYHLNIRPKGNRGVLKYLDIRQNDYINDGFYAAELKGKMLSSNAAQAAEDLLEFLRGSYKNVNFKGPIYTDSYRWIAIDFDLKECNSFCVRISVTPAESITITYRIKGGTLQEFEKAMKSIGVNKINNNLYAWPDPSWNRRPVKMVGGYLKEIKLRMDAILNATKSLSD